MKPPNLADPGPRSGADRARAIRTGVAAGQAGALGTAPAGVPVMPPWGLESLRVRRLRRSREADGNLDEVTC